MRTYVCTFSIISITMCQCDTRCLSFSIKLILTYIFRVQIKRIYYYALKGTLRCTFTNSSKETFRANNNAKCCMIKFEI